MTSTISIAYHVGLWIIQKYRAQAKDHGTFKAASNMRKQGFPIELARAVLAKEWK